MAHRIRTHPGEILAEEFLKPLHMSVNALALELRVPANRLGEIIKKRRTVTADTAMRLARFFGTTAEFWLNAQTAFDLSKAQAELGAKIARDIRPRAA
jgi:addiction module HigA family antidote